MAWRDTARIPKIGPIDASAGPAVLIFLLHMSKVTFYTSITIVLLLAMLPLFGWTPKQFIRMVLWKITGNIVYCGTPAWRYLRRSRY